MGLITRFQRTIRMTLLCLSVTFSAPCIPLTRVAHSPTIKHEPDPLSASRYITATDFEVMITGSGSIVGPNVGLTAAHVCVPSDNWSPGQWVYQAYDNSGAWQFIVPVVIDFDNDVCLFYFSERAKDWLWISRLPPKIEELVFYTGFPKGVYHPGTTLKFFGYYGGSTERGAIYSLPSAYGSSGSAIYNSNGEVVGMVTMTVEGFGHISLGPELKWIHRAYDLYLENPGSIVLVINGEVTGYSLISKE